MKRSLKNIFCIFIFCFGQTTFAINESGDSLLQIERAIFANKPKTGWEISGNFGVYKANKYQAQFYNGGPENVNTIDYVFSNYYWNQEITDLMVTNVNRDSFFIAAIPYDIKYDASMYVGFSARYNFSNEMAMNFSFNFAKLTTRDMVVLEVWPPYSGAVESYVYCGIFGQEARTNIDAGFLYTFSPEKPFTGFAEMGLNINSTHVKKSFIQIFDREYNLINLYGSSSYVPNTPLTEMEVRQGGIGFGTYISPGIRYVMNQQFSMELAGLVYLKTVNLEGYGEKLGLHYGAVFRLVLSPFFNFSSEDETITY